MFKSAGVEWSGKKLLNIGTFELRNYLYTSLNGSESSNKGSGMMSFTEE